MSNKEQASPGRMIEASYKISGMTCAACAVSLESYLKAQQGVKQVSVNYPNQSALIAWNASQISFEDIQAKAHEIGYEVIDGSGDEAQKTFDKKEALRLNTLKIKLFFSALFSLPVFLIAMFFMGKLAHANWMMLALSLPVMLWSGNEFFIIAWKKLKHFSANMDTLVALSTGVAFSFSAFNTFYPQFFLSRHMTPHVYYESAVVIITLILLGRYLEEKAKSKTSSAIKKLMGLNPKQLTVIRNGLEVVIKFEEILKGERIVLKPGDKVPVDGKVKKGNSYIDQSMISGEPMPVAKQKGDPVFAGTINQKGALEIIATKVGRETLLAQIIHQVEQAQNSKPEIQKIADRVASIFVPVVMALALISFSIWYWFGPQPSFPYALSVLMTVLIIACPCALGLATPTALMVGIGKGAENGILMKDAQSLETAYRIDTLILDKTGTITEGRPRVSDFIWAHEDRDKLSSVLLGLEKQSEHPLAGAIVQYLDEEKVRPAIIEQFQSITGLGAQAQIEEKAYRIGSQKFMLQEKVEIPEKISQNARILSQEAKTLVYFAVQQKVVALIAIADQIKTNARESISQIQKMGIDVFMFTGDHQQTAAVIAKAVGIKHFRAEVMPGDKGQGVLDLQQKGRIVAMAGDGINDAHALAQANVGIAMGSGTDIAMESAGITLVYSDLSQISKAISLSKATMQTIRQNLFWAFIYNLIAIPVAAGVLYPSFGFLLNPMIAGAAMSLSSISVLSNSLRLKRKKLN